MKLVRAAWRLLVGIKDALVLAALLLFFGLIFAALSARPGSRPITDGALVLDLNGPVVEQPTEPAAFAALSGQDTTRQYRLRDVVRAIDAARDDARVKVLVLDLDRFGGAYPAALGEMADAILRVRSSGKPVLAFATGYLDSSYRLAAAASEVWVDPLGGTLFSGPGGTQPYLKGLIDRLGVTVHVYRVGRFKAAVEPFTRADQSPESRQANQALYGALLEQWRDGVRRARPKAQVDNFLARPEQAVLAAGGSIAQANLRAGLVDRLGGREAFERRVVQLAGADATKLASGGYRRIGYDQWLAAHPVTTTGDAVGVVTIAGNIVDGQAGPGTAAGDTIANAVAKGLQTGRLKALVVRVDSPGGSVTASERIRQAVLAAKARGLPIIVSMGGIAASGGYWVSTAGERIFAEPSTITGSIGIFAVFPTFEQTLAKVGITGDGVQTTPLSGQPDLLRGTNPVLDSVLQSSVENGYRQFIGRVAQARRLSPQRVDEIGQGRVWDGGTARQIGLVDQFGTLGDAIAYAARRANLNPATVSVQYLEKEPGLAARFAQALASDSDTETEAGAGADLVGRIAAGQRAAIVRALGDARRLASGGSVQARCLECAAFGPAVPAAGDARLLDFLLAKVGLAGF